MQTPATLHKTIYLHIYNQEQIRTFSSLNKTPHRDLQKNLKL